MIVKAKKSFNKSYTKPFDLSKVSARVDRVNVSGLSRTKDDYVLRAADSLFKAKTFQEIMIESMNARSYLLELGIFTDVIVRIDISKGENATPNGYEITFKGKEHTRIFGSLGTEVGQNEGLLRSELTFPNLFGRGESISLQGAYSNTRASDVALKFWKPLFHTKLMPNRPEISLSAFRHTNRMDVSSFKTTNMGLIADFSISTLFPFQLQHSFQYESSIREISLLTRNVPFAIRDHCGPRLASLLRYSVILDQRDNPVFPSQGFMLHANSEYSGFGGNIDYKMCNLHAEMSVPLFGGLVAQTCGRIGLIQPTKSTLNLPISNLFYFGGPQTLRGFQYGGAGPRIEDKPIGAKSYWSVGFHLWAPMPFSRIFKELSNNLRTHIFYNLGNSNSFTTEDMRIATGIGLGIKLAERARIEINYCFPLRKYAGDKDVNSFQFSVGYEFI